MGYLGYGRLGKKSGRLGRLCKNEVGDGRFKSKMGTGAGKL